MRLAGYLLFVGFSAYGAVAGCSSSNSIKANSDGGAVPPGDCSNPPALGDNGFCSSCSFAASAMPSTCTPARPVNACCAWVGAPSAEIQRGTGLHYFSTPGPDTTPDIGCLTVPPQAGASQTVTLTGFVKLFSSGGDSSGVKIEIFKEGPNKDGAIGALVGSAVITTSDDVADPPYKDSTGQLPTWLSKCPTDGCKFRSFTYAGVPTETALIIKTSDALGSGTWAELYDYNIYFSNGAIKAGDAGATTVAYDPSALAATDIGVVAATVGATVKPGKGLIAGEVHDCGDVRLSGATVDSDQPHDGQMFYFTSDESNPLPDLTNQKGTSRLGLFGSLNFPTQVPIRLSAVGKVMGQDVLLGTYVVQTFPNAVTALSFRGRRPSQQ